MTYSETVTITLATRRYRDMGMAVRQVRHPSGAIEHRLETIGKRAPNLAAPIGLQRYEESRFPAPIFVATGSFDEDAAIASDWLEANKVYVYEADNGRPVNDILTNPDRACDGALGGLTSACTQDRVTIWHGMDTPAQSCGWHYMRDAQAVFNGHRARIENEMNGSK